MPLKLIRTSFPLLTEPVGEGEMNTSAAPGHSIYRTQWTIMTKQKTATRKNPVTLAG